jgi:hypothetical protein
VVVYERCTEGKKIKPKKKKLKLKRKPRMEEREKNLGDE